MAAAWFLGLDARDRSDAGRRLLALRALSTRAAPGGLSASFADEVTEPLLVLAAAARVAVDVPQAVAYLIEAHDDLTITGAAADLAGRFTEWARTANLAVDGLSFADLARMVDDWAVALDDAATVPPARRTEAALAVLGGSRLRTAAGVDLRVEVPDLLSDHPSVAGGTLTLDVDVAHGAYEVYRRDFLPRFTAAAAARRT